MCNLFKPERCHHCSSCEKCILNMDHHCPWVNNCIGFNNRKYFILLLVYVFTLTYFYWISTSVDVYMNLMWMIEYFKGYHLSDHFEVLKVLSKLLTIILFLATLTLSIIITKFGGFHFWLLFENKTTIENLEKKKVNYHSEWDLGNQKNFYQVFGRNFILWPFPVMFQSGRPEGNGIEWEKFNSNGSFVTNEPQQSA